jgi:aspartyl-tRNA synthetase
VNAPRPNRYRDTWAGELDAGRAGQEARVSGWVHRRRDHGGLIFIDLRDRSGILQLVFHPDGATAAHAAAHTLRSEDVITVSGEVRRRAPENVNPHLATGEIELAVSTIEILADADTPPFQVDDDGVGGGPNEELRLRHRSLDLRRTPMQEAIALRHQIVRAMREVLDGRDFLEIETPFLTRSTPEGARDFLVPARMTGGREPGRFFALPQSPQLFKQLLMIGGFERYYQIVRCFRDEDSRADRTFEFTQLDIEMGFVEEDDVLEMMEAVMSAVFAVNDFDVAPAPWPRMTHAEAMSRFGSDRPDTRFGLELCDLGGPLAGTEFKVFAGALSSGGVVRAINAGARQLPRSELDALTDFVKQHGAKGLVWAFVESVDSWRSPIAKFLTPAEIAAVNERLEASVGDVLFIVADTASVAGAALGALRLELARRFSLIGEGVHDIRWIVRFPMFAYKPEEGRWDAEHHPFTAPATAAGEPASAADLDDPAPLLSRSYDLVLDGFEIGGGSIRNHRLDVQRRVFELIGIDEAEADARFGFLLQALRYGAPPHGGIAMGVDRIVALLAGRDNIREVIAFPKATSGGDPLTGAPAPVDAVQLRELGIRLI